MVINYYFFIITQNNEFIGISFKKCGSTIESEKSAKDFCFSIYLCIFALIKSKTVRQPLG